MLNILNIEPNKVSRNINTYSYLFYGNPKIGKTTIATQFPKCLLIAPEKGYKAIPGVKPAPINSWGDFLSVLNQLLLLTTQRDAAVAKGEDFSLPYETVAIDVVDILYDYCTKYILQRESADSVKDIPHGAGYGMIEKEFDEKIQKIVSAGYGLVLLSHAQEGVTDSETGISKNTPTMEKRCKKICTRLVDLYGFLTKAKNDKGEEIRLIFTEDCPYGDAGNRIDYLEGVIPLNYVELEKAILRAIEKKEEEINNPDLFTSNKLNFYKVEKTEDFEKVKEDINKIIGVLMENTDNKDNMAIRIRSVIKESLGSNNTLESADASQIQHLILIRNNLEEIKEV